MSDEQSWVVEVIDRQGGDREEVGDGYKNKEAAQAAEDRIVQRTTGVISSRVRRVD